MENNYMSLLAQLDGSEKDEIITAEELEEIGAAYGSIEEYQNAMRRLEETLSGGKERRGAFYVSASGGKAAALVKAGTSTVPVGNLHKIKRLNIVGKKITSTADAAQLFSAFRDPRLEIVSTIFTSKTGDILAHTAWTSGLPGMAYAAYKGGGRDNLSLLKKTKEQLGADKLWLAHNHPGGNPEPSAQDLAATKSYASYFGNSFSGHIVLDHTTYSFITPEGSFSIRGLKKPARNFISRRRAQSLSIHSPDDAALIFKKALSREEDISVFAVLDGQNKVVSWIYSDSAYELEIKNYMRVSGGSSSMVLTNSEKLYKQYVNRAESVKDTKYDIFLDVIKVNRRTGIFEKSKAQISPGGGKWQIHEAKKVKFIVQNKNIQMKLALETEEGLNRESTGNKEARGGKENGMNEKIEGINRMINEKSEKREDGVLRMSKDDWNGINRELNKGKGHLFDKAMFHILSGRQPSDEETAAMAAERAKESFEKRENTGGENGMAEKAENENGEKKELSPRDKAFLNTVHQRKVIMEAVKNGTLCCMPKADGYADTQAAYNLSSGKVYHGINLLYIKEHQKRNGFPTGEYLTLEAFEKMKKEKPELYIRKDQKPVTLNVFEKNKAGEWEDKFVKLFNAAQTSQPWEVKALAAKSKEEEKQKYIAYMRKQHGEKWQPSVVKEEELPAAVLCTGAEPEKYLGQYLAAVSMRTTFKASAEQAAEFAKNMEASVYEKAGVSAKTGKPITNPAKLAKISCEASRYCREYIKEIRMEARKQNQDDRKIPQRQSRGRGR